MRHVSQIKSCSSLPDQSGVSILQLETLEAAWQDLIIYIERAREGAGGGGVRQLVCIIRHSMTNSNHAFRILNFLSIIKNMSIA